MDIEGPIRRYLAEEFLTVDEAAALRPGDELLEFLNSIAILRTVKHVETTFGIKVPDADLTIEKLGSLERLVRYVEQHR